MKRKQWLRILAGLSCCCCLLGVAACGDDAQKPVDLTSLELTTQKPATEAESMFRENPKTDILVGSCIDVEDYIIKHKDGRNRAVQFQYTDKSGAVQTVAVKGATYYPTVSGKYTLIYTQQFDDKILRDSMQITVYSPQPVIDISDIPLYYSKGRKVRLRLLLNNANPFCELSNNYTIENVTYRKYELNLEETVKEGSEKITDLTGATEFTFDEYGTYIFSFYTEVDGLKGYSSFRVEVVEENVGNEDTLLVKDKKEDESAEDTYSYASGHVQVDGNTVRLIQSEYKSASYLVLEEDYYDQDVLRFEFKGKNAPQVGLLTIPNEEANNPYTIISGQGYTLSFENTYTDMFSIWGYGGDDGKGEGRFNGMNWHNGNSWTGYFGRNDFENDKYYMVETKLDAGSVEGLLSVFYLRIYEIENYGTETQTYTMVYDAEVPACQRQGGKIEKGKIVFYGSSKEDVTFKYYKPVGRVNDFQVEGKTVTWAAKEGAVGYMVSPNGVNYTFQEENSFTFNNFIENLTPLYVKPVVDNGFTNLTNGEALEWTRIPRSAEGDQSTKKVNLTDGAAVFNKYVPPKTEAYTGDDFVGSDGVTFTKEAGLDKTHANVSLPFVSGVAQSYVETKEAYGDGTYVAMEFIGSKCPTYILFGVTENSQAKDGAVGVGIDLDYTTWGAVGYYKANAETERIMTTEKLDTRLTRGYFKSTGFDAYYAVNEDFPFAAITKYLLVIGAKQDGANVNIQYYLFAQTGAEEWTRYEVNALQIPNATLQEGKISVRSTAFVAGMASEFKMYQPDTLENVNKVLGEVYGVHCFDASSVFTLSGGANVDLNADDTYQLNAPLVANNDKAYNYVATKQTYGSGTYVMAEFTGKNLPGMVLFGVNNVTEELKFTNTQVEYTKQATWNGVSIYTDLMWGQVLTYGKAADGEAVYKSEVGLFNRHTDLGYGIGTENTFVLIIGAENVGNDVSLTYTLYKKDGASVTLFETRTYTITGVSIGEGSIVFTSPHQGAGRVANIKLWTIGTKTEVETKFNAVYTGNA